MHGREIADEVLALEVTRTEDASGLPFTDDEIGLAFAVTKA